LASGVGAGTGGFRRPVSALLRSRSQHGTIAVTRRAAGGFSAGASRFDGGRDVGVSDHHEGTAGDVVAGANRFSDVVYAYLVRDCRGPVRAGSPALAPLDRRLLAVGRVGAAPGTRQPIGVGMTRGAGRSPLLLV